MWLGVRNAEFAVLGKAGREPSRPQNRTARKLVGRVIEKALSVWFLRAARVNSIKILVWGEETLMGNAANFTVIRDAWTTGLNEGVDFEVSSTIDTARKTVLTFMLDNFSHGDVGIVIRINGKKVWNWSYTSEQVQMYQEVIEEGVIRAGTNRINCEQSLNDDGSLDFAGFQFSDIVLWYRVNV